MKKIFFYFGILLSLNIVSQNAVKFDYDKGGNMTQKQVRIMNMRLNTSKDSVLKFNVYPNPAKDQFTIEGALEDNKEASIILYNSNGALVKQDSYYGVKKSYSLGGLSNGIYFLEINYDKKQGGHYKIIITQ